MSAGSSSMHLAPKWFPRHNPDETTEAIHHPNLSVLHLSFMFLLLLTVPNLTSLTIKNTFGHTMGSDLQEEYRNLI